MMATKPMVFRKDGKQRRGKGFSREELKKVGLSLKEALRFGIPIDSRRKTAHEDNIKMVKTLLEEKKGKRPKRKSKN